MDIDNNEKNESKWVKLKAIFVTEKKFKKMHLVINDI